MTNSRNSTTASKSAALEKYRQTHQPRSWQERFILLAHDPATGTLNAELLKRTSQHERHEIHNQVNRRSNQDIYVVPVSKALQSEKPVKTSRKEKTSYKAVREKLEHALSFESGGNRVQLKNLKNFLREEHLAKRAGVPAVRIYKDVGAPLTEHLRKKYGIPQRHTLRRR